MSAPHGPGPDEGRGVAARLVYDPNIATVSEETLNELIAIMRITVAIIDGGERQFFNQPLFSGLPTCKPSPHFGDLAPLGRHHFGREAAHGGIAAPCILALRPGRPRVAGGSFRELDTAPVDPCRVCCALAASGVKTAVVASISVGRSRRTLAAPPRRARPRPAPRPRNRCQFLGPARSV